MKSAGYQAIRREYCSDALTKGEGGLCSFNGSRLKIARSLRRATRASVNKMLAIRRSAKQPGKCHPNLLPCKINHNGSVDASDRHWKPSDKGESLIFYRSLFVF